MQTTDLTRFLHGVIYRSQRKRNWSETFAYEDGIIARDTILYHGHMNDGQHWHGLLGRHRAYKAGDRSTVKFFSPSARTAAYHAMYLGGGRGVPALHVYRATQELRLRTFHTLDGLNEELSAADIPELEKEGSTYDIRALTEYCKLRRCAVALPFDEAGMAMAPEMVETLASQGTFVWFTAEDWKRLGDAFRETPPQGNLWRIRRNLVESIDANVSAEDDPYIRQRERFVQRADDAWRDASARGAVYTFQVVSTPEDGKYGYVAPGDEDVDGQMISVRSHSRPPPEVLYDTGVLALFPPARLKHISTSVATVVRWTPTIASYDLTEAFLETHLVPLEYDAFEGLGARQNIRAHNALGRLGRMMPP